MSWDAICSHCHLEHAIRMNPSKCTPAHIDILSLCCIWMKEEKKHQLQQEQQQAFQDVSFFSLVGRGKMKFCKKRHGTEVTIRCAYAKRETMSDYIMNLTRLMHFDGVSWCSTFVTSFLIFWMATSSSFPFLFFHWHICTIVKAKKRTRQMI